MSPSILDHFRGNRNINFKVLPDEKFVKDIWFHSHFDFWLNLQYFNCITVSQFTVLSIYYIHYHFIITIHKSLEQLNFVIEFWWKYLFWSHICLYFLRNGSNLTVFIIQLILGVRMYKMLFYLPFNDEILFKVQFNSFKL